MNTGGILLLLALGIGLAFAIERKHRRERNVGRLRSDRLDLRTELERQAWRDN